MRMNQEKLYSNFREEWKGYSLCTIGYETIVFFLSFYFLKKNNSKQR